MAAPRGVETDTPQPHNPNSRHHDWKPYLWPKDTYKNGLSGLASGSWNQRCPDVQLRQKDALRHTGTGMLSSEDTARATDARSSVEDNHRNVMLRERNQKEGIRYILTT